MRIQVILGILWIYTQAAMGSLIQDPVVCRFNNINQCYVALGQRLHLQIPLEEKDGFRLTFTDKTSNDRLIIRYRKTQSNPPTPNHPGWQFVNDNNMMILTRAERSDSGTYSLIISDVKGNHKGDYSLQLNTEARVSSVKVSYSCLSPGVMKVFCSAAGDNLRFNWTSHSNPVPQMEDGNSTLLLNTTQSGNVTCLVENHVSRADYTTGLQECPEATTTAATKTTPSTTSAQTQEILLIIMSTVCLFLIMVSILVCYIYKKRQRQKNKEVIPQDRELVYAQVTHLPMNSTEGRPRRSQAQDENVEYATVVSQSKKMKQNKNEEQVQYGEVVFNTEGKKKRKTPKEQDECVYSQVQHIR